MKDSSTLNLHEKKNITLHTNPHKKKKKAMILSNSYVFIKNMYIFDMTLKISTPDTG